MAVNLGGHGFNNPFSGLGIGPQSIAGALGVGAMVAEKLPGYDAVQNQLQRFNIDLSTVTTWMLIVTALWTVWSFVTRNVYTLLDTYYCCSVRITSEDGLFHDLFSWLQEERAADISVTRTCDAKRQLEYPDQGNDGTRYGLPLAISPWPVTGRQMSQVVYNPTPGALYHFRHNGHTIQIVREQINDPSVLVNPGQLPRETVRLKYYGREPQVLRAVLDDVVLRSNLRDQGKTVVYQAILVHGQNRWDRSMLRPNRSISTVVLEEDQKARVVEDIKEYLLPATAKWYANRGLPYRRGYLLYGPPGNYIYNQPYNPERYLTNSTGTGKTSLTMALAGHFNLEVYNLSLNAQDLTDDVLASMFTLLPKRCIVLLEDVDASGIRRGSGAPTASPEPEPKVTNQPRRFNHEFIPPKKSEVSFAGLINAIDGAAAKEGRILIMTTNYRENLDEALIRPGRVDLQVEFAFASKQVILELFENLYDVSNEDLAMPADFPSKKEVLQLARQFSDLVPEGCFTPAEIQGLLLLYKKSPQAALANTPSWLKRKLVGREVKVGEKASIDTS